MTSDDALERGAVCWVELDPVRGSEIAKTRPCVLLSASVINRSRRTVVVVPLTSTPEAPRFPLLVAVPSAGSSSKARIEHIRCVDKSRLQRRIGRLSPNDLDAIGRALLRVLGMG